jgi:peptidyl-dipeptidase Dcp
MVAAIFDCAHSLFGLRFIPRPDIATYHPDVKTYEVKETVDGVERTVGVFLHGEYSCTVGGKAQPKLSKMLHLI